MHKTLAYSVADLCADLDAVTTAIRHACRQPSGPYRVRGMIQAGDHVVFQLLPAGKAPLETYHFLQLQDCDAAELVGTLNERWTAGFDALAAVAAGDGLSLVLLARPEKPA